MSFLDDSFQKLVAYIADRQTDRQADNKTDAVGKKRLSGAQSKR